MAAIVNAETCTGCGVCVDVCPVEAIKVEDDLAKIDAELCTDCAACVDECPTGAISLP